MRPQSTTATVILKVTRDCNMRCEYCYEVSGANTGSRISFETVASSYRQFLQSGLFEAVDFVYHGGEPLLLSPAVFRKLLEKQRIIAGSQGATTAYKNCVQTNGTLITEKWIELFEEFDVDVGISVDFPPEYHDSIRKSITGEETFDSVVSNVKDLQERGCPSVGVLTVITSRNIAYLTDLYTFFRNEQIPFRPIFYFPDHGPDTDPLVASPTGLADGLIGMFDAWYQDEHPAEVALFRDIVDGFFKGENRSCTFSGRCSECFGIDTGGDIYVCDRFSNADFRIGNILADDIRVVIRSSVVAMFRKRSSLVEECKDCEWFRYCHGGCAYHGYVIGGSIACKDYYCETRRRLLAHIYSTLAKEEKNAFQEGLESGSFCQEQESSH